MSDDLDTSPQGQTDTRAQTFSTGLYSWPVLTLDSVSLAPFGRE